MPKIKSRVKVTIGQQLQEYFADAIAAAPSEAEETAWMVTIYIFTFGISFCKN